MTYKFKIDDVVIYTDNSQGQLFNKRFKVTNPGHDISWVVCMEDINERYTQGVFVGIRNSKLELAIEKKTRCQLELFND